MSFPEKLVGPFLLAASHQALVPATAPTSAALESATVPPGLSLKRTCILFIITAIASSNLACTAQQNAAPTQFGVENVNTGSPAGTSAGEDWPQFLGPRQDGTSSETGIRTDWSAGKLPVVWSKEFGTSYGIGSIANDRYYQFHRIGNNERLSCLHARTGAVIWEVDQPVEYEDMYGYNNGPRTSPTIDDDLVYTMGVAGQLTCRGVTDGALKWTVDTNSRYGVVQNFFGVGCSPLVVDDLVIVMVGGSPAADQKLPPGRLDRVSPNGSALVAFDKLTGKERYKIGDYLASYSTLRSVETSGGEKLVLAFVREGLLAVKASSGQQAWMYPWRSDLLESVNAAVPVIDGDEVLVSECYEIGSSLLDFNSQSYNVIRTDSNNRRLQTFRAHWATPIKVGDFLYGCSGRNPPDSDLRCVNWETGELAWSDDRRERSSLLYIDGHFVVLNERGMLELIKATPQQYQPITSLDLSIKDLAAPNRPILRYPCWAAPIVSHGLMYVRGEQTTICFELIPED